MSHLVSFSLMIVLLIIVFLILLLFLLLIVTFWGWARLGQLNVVLYHLICEYYTLIGSSNPGGLRLYLDRRHVEFFEDFLLKSRVDVWFLDVRQTEENSGPDRSSKWQNYFRKYWTKPILNWERYEFSLLFVIFSPIGKRISGLLLNKTYKSWKLILYFSLRHRLLQIFQ